MKIQTCPLLILAAFIGYQNIVAQSACDNFNSCAIDSTNSQTIDSTRDHAFNTLGNGNPGCLSQWEVTSGTPSLYDNTGGLAGGFGTASTGTHFAILGVCGDYYPTQWSDGVAFKYNFQPGGSYTVTIAMRTTDSSAFIGLDFVLLQSKINYQYNYNIGCSATPPIPGTGLLVDSVRNFATAHWQTVTFTINGLSDTFNRLWMRPLIDQGVTANFCFDAFCINQSKEQSTCDDFNSCRVDSTNAQTIDSTMDHAFNTLGNGNPGCLSAWEVASGTPALWDNTRGIQSGLGTASTGTRYALLGVCGDYYPTQWSDAVVYKFDFHPGNSYTVSMAIRTTDSSAYMGIDYVLLQSKINYQYSYNVGCSATPPIPGNGVLVDTVRHFATAWWQTLTFTINGLTDTFNRLWIRPLIDQGATANFCFDAFCIDGITAVPTLAGVEAGSLKAVPNPFSNQTTITYALPEGVESASVVVTDILGREVSSRFFRNALAGKFDFESSGLSPGLYLCQLVSDGRILATTKLILSR